MVGAPQINIFGRLPLVGVKIPNLTAIKPLDLLPCPEETLSNLIEENSDLKMSVSC